MTIKEFIEELKKYPEDYEIKRGWAAGVSDFDVEDIKYGLDDNRKELVI